MKKLRGILGTGAGAAAWLWMAAANARVEDLPGGPAVNQLDLHEGVTTISKSIWELNWMIMIICAIIFVGVFGVMFYSIIMHRKSRKHVVSKMHEHTVLEVTWTVIPFLIIVGMAVPATRTVVAMKDTSNPDMTVKVTGYQWKWGYDYVDGPAAGVHFLSNLTTPLAQIDGREPKDNAYLLEVDHPLVVPVNKKVRIIVTADDVIHSWSVPDFGVKQDAIPGFLRDTWFRAQKIGTYRGQCSELCGKNHAYMPIVVKVVSDADYLKWAQQEKGSTVASAAGSATGVSQ